MAWYATMCNPHEMHPAIYDSVVLQGGISGADVGWCKTLLHQSRSTCIRRPCPVFFFAYKLCSHPATAFNAHAKTLSVS